ncbi:hypothetical protein KKA87_13705 [bacterium]|nr:hypothetical protein [bacterium]
MIQLKAPWNIGRIVDGQRHILKEGNAVAVGDGVKSFTGPAVLQGSQGIVHRLIVG